MPNIRLQVERKALHIVITDMCGQCALKNIRYRGNQALPGGQKVGEMGPEC